MGLNIRRAVSSDAETVLEFVQALAVYEKLEHEVEASAADIMRDLFAPHPRVFAEIAEWEARPAGFALWFYTYSTFQGRHGIWLEDLFVHPDRRGYGIGKALLAELAQRCVTESLGRLEWWVLDWNRPSIAFYESQGALLQDDWTKCRVSGDALVALARR